MNMRCPYCNRQLVVLLQPVPIPHEITDPKESKEEWMKRLKVKPEVTWSAEASEARMREEANSVREDLPAPPVEGGYRGCLPESELKPVGKDEYEQTGAGWAEPPEDDEPIPLEGPGWDAARQIAGLLDGRDYDRALRIIEEQEAKYRAAQ